MSKAPRHTSIYMSPATRQQLHYLSEVFGESKSSVMKRLIQQTFTTLYAMEQAKKNLNSPIAQLLTSDFA